MNNPRLGLKDRLVIRFTERPESLDMCDFSTRAESGTTFCLAGSILDECKVALHYGREGYAIGLAPGETPASKPWLACERSILISRGRPSRAYLGGLMMMASARERWALEYGALSALHLPFYGLDWQADEGVQGDLRRITARHVVDRLVLIASVREASLP